MQMERPSKTLHDLELLVNSHKNNKFTNGFVYHIFVNNKKNAKKTATYLLELGGHPDCKASSLQLVLSRLNARVTSLKTNITRNWANFECLLNADFLFPVSVVKQPLSTVQPKMPPPISPLKTKTSKECFACDKKQQCNRELFKENLKLKLSYSAEKKEKFQIKKTYQVNRVKQQLERKGLRIGKFQSKVKTLQDKIASLSNSLKRAHLKCSILSKQKKKCHSQLNALQLKITDLEKKLISKDAALLHDIPHVENYDAQTIVTKVNKKQFNSSIRMVIYRCLELNVPVEAISKVIAFCTDLCNAQVDLPSVSTIAQMCREMAVLAELQVSEAIIDADVVTIAFDATTISGKHINEVHFGTPENVFTANITELAGGRAEDYAGHVLNTIEDLATTYSSFCEVDKEETKLQMCGKVSSTLTDRASANHAAVLLLNEKLQTNLLELNCHLHPLDGIANEVRKTFQKFNSLIPSDTFGSDCRAANLLYGISKLRYKAKGDPTGFKAFLRQHSLACGIFPRYVGNRLHVMFCLAGIVYRHRHLLVLYLEKYCSNISLRAALLKDLKNDIIISQLQALGLWGKYLTGAWMSVFYAKESKRNHFDMVEYQKVAMKFIARVIAEPEYLLIGCEDAFGRPLIADETLSSLLIVDDTNLEAFSTATKAMATATQTVLSRQLSRYLEGDLAAPTEAMLAAAASAPVHNIWAERALGVVDSLSRRAPNSEITFLDAKTKVKLNKSLDWLSSKPAAVQQQIIQFCIKRGAVCRKLGKDRRIEKERELQRRLMEKSQKRDMGNRNKIAKTIKQLLIEKELFTVINDPVFANVSSFQRKKLSIFLSDRVEGARIEHKWNVNGEDVIFSGRFILKLKKKSAVDSFRVAYWKENETEDDAEDVCVSFDSILADVVLGDLLFC